MQLRRKLVVATAVTASLAIGGAAYAYWTTTAGSGTGTGSTAATTGALSIDSEGTTLVDDATSPAETPLPVGGSARLKVRVTNSNPYDLKLSQNLVATAHLDGALRADGSAGPLDCGVTIADGGAGTVVPKRVGLVDGSVDVFLSVTWVDLGASINQDGCLDQAISFDINPPAT